ncbi:Nn.00g022280.m01.CDS01 [Neocucurbitaria sp. VM-36]
MLFRRHSPSRLHPVASPTDPFNAQSPPKTSTRTQKTLEEILALSASLTKPLPQEPRSVTNHYHFSNSPQSDRSSERQVSPTREPRSKKTGHATIHTDATGTHGAFESDAFAVHMPTTRLPILDRAISPTKSSPAAQAAAYQTYKEKARQVRERNNSQGIRVPSKIVSYDYASPTTAGHKASLVKEVDPLSSVPMPAGSFPISPPLPQSGWTRPQPVYKAHFQGSRGISAARKTQTPSKPAGLSSNTRVANKWYTYQSDSEAGASCSTSSPSSSPTRQAATIKVRIKPRVVVPEAERVQTESRYSFYNRPSSNSSPPTSRSPSPVKSMPNFRRHNSIEGDSIFGYRSKDIAGAVAGASSTSGSDKEKEKKNALDKYKKKAPKRTLTSRLPWLRPSGPRVAKPVAVPVTSTAPTTQSRTYVDPFERLATPTPPPPLLRTPIAIRPASPRKMARETAPESQGKFDTGFAQIKGLTFLLLKIGFFMYGVVALWFVLDAIREVFNTLSAPFRAFKWAWGFVWLLCIWIMRIGILMWDRWVFGVVLQSGWMWKMT